MTEISVEGCTNIEKIGEGAMSEVFKANIGQSIVALKVLRRFYKGNKDYEERIQKEADTLSKILNHKIVKFISLSRTDDDRLTIIQEYVNGTDLESLFTKHDNNPVSTVASAVVSEVLQGIEEAHRSGIIHRDLKPENIMLTSEGDIKITDFGIAKNLESQELTMTGIICGSPAYMSPEQACGEKVKFSTDLYSLGVLLYRLSTGKLPFSGSSYQEIVKNISNGKYIAPEKINNKIHPELSRIIKKSIHSNSNKRYGHAFEFQYDLIKYLNHINAPSSTVIIKEYFKNGNDWTIFEDKLMSTLIKRTKFAINKNEIQQSEKIARQALALDNDNTEIMNLLKPQKSYVKYIVTAIILLLVFSFKFQSIFNIDSTKKIQVTSRKIKIDSVQIKTSSVKKKQAVSKPMISIVKKRVVINKKKMPKKRVPKKIVPLKRSVVRKTPQITKVIPSLPQTHVVFNVPDDIRVYLDNKVVDHPKVGVRNLKPGIHSLTLIKENFKPISSVIEVLSGKTTTINVGARQ